MCKWQEALSILPHINAILWELGMQWEQYLGYTCDGAGTYPDIFYRINRFREEDNSHLPNPFDDDYWEYDGRLNNLESKNL